MVSDHENFNNENTNRNNNLAQNIGDFGEKNEKKSEKGNLLKELFSFKNAKKTTTVQRARKTQKSLKRQKIFKARKSTLRSSRQKMTLR